MVSLGARENGGKFVQQLDPRRWPCRGCAPSSWNCRVSDMCLGVLKTGTRYVDSRIVVGLEAMSVSVNLDIGGLPAKNFVQSATKLAFSTWKLSSVFEIYCQLVNSPCTLETNQE